MKLCSVIVTVTNDRSLQVHIRIRLRAERMWFVIMPLCKMTKSHRHPASAWLTEYNVLNVYRLYWMQTTDTALSHWYRRRR